MIAAAKRKRTTAATAKAAEETEKINVREDDDCSKNVRELLVLLTKEVRELREENENMNRKIDEIKAIVEKEFNPTPLWKLVTEIPDLFEKEVLTKLDAIDLKIFYDLCRASREVVVRSKIELNNKIRNVSDVESMREFQLAWEHYRWGEEDMYGIEMTQERFCHRVARTNNLEFLKWAREVKRCAWDEETIGCAAYQGNLSMVKYCVENDCPMDWKACACAASEGHLDVLKYLHEHDCPWDSKTLLVARRDDQIECLNYAIEQKCPGWEQFDPEHSDYDPPEIDSDSDDEDEEEEEDVGEE